MALQRYQWSLPDNLKNPIRINPYSPYSYLCLLIRENSPHHKLKDFQLGKCISRSARLEHLRVHRYGNAPIPAPDQPRRGCRHKQGAVKSPSTCKSYVHVLVLYASTNHLLKNTLTLQMQLNVPCYINISWQSAAAFPTKPSLRREPVAGLIKLRTRSRNSTGSVYGRTDPQSLRGLSSGRLACFANTWLKVSIRKSIKRFSLLPCPKIKHTTTPYSKSWGNKWSSLLLGIEDYDKVADHVAKLKQDRTRYVWQNSWDAQILNKVTLHRIYPSKLLPSNGAWHTAILPRQQYFIVAS